MPTAWPAKPVLKLFFVTETDPAEFGRRCSKPAMCPCWIERRWKFATVRPCLRDVFSFTPGSAYCLVLFVSGWRGRRSREKSPDLQRNSGLEFAKVGANRKWIRNYLSGGGAL